MENYSTKIEELKAAMENGTANRYTVMGCILDLAFEVGAKRIESLDDIDPIVEAKTAIRSLADKAVGYAWRQGINFQKELTKSDAELIKELTKRVWG